jgi:hypothetical protein
MSILFPSGMQFLSRAAVLTVSYITNADLQARFQERVFRRRTCEHAAIVHTRRTAPRLSILNANSRETSERFAETPRALVTMTKGSAAVAGGRPYGRYGSAEHTHPV